MPRKPSTKTTENPTEQMMNAVDTPVNLEWSAIAEKLNTSIPNVQEHVSAKLNDSTVFAWDNLPVEHEPLIEQIARDLESEASVRRLTPEQETPQLPPQPTELALVEEEAPKVKHISRFFKAIRTWLDENPLADDGAFVSPGGWLA